MSHRIHIDTETFVRFWAVPLILVAIGLFISKAWTGLIIVCAAIFLALAVKPLADNINKLFRKIGGKNREGLSNILAFITILVVLVLIVAVIFPVVAKEVSAFFESAPKMISDFLKNSSWINDFGSKIGIDNLRDEIVNGINNFASSIVGNFGTMLSGIGSFLSAALMTIILTVFFLSEGPKVYDKVFDKLSDSRKDKSVNEIRRILSRMANVVSMYVSRQVVIATIDGIAVMIAVFILSLIFKFSYTLCFPMGLISMIFYMIPMFGQFIGAALISVILFISSPIAAAIYLIFYIVYAQIEGNVIATYLQGDAMKLSPLIILISIIIGMYAAGLVGAIVAIPIAGCLKVLIEEYPRIKALRNKD